MAELRWAQSPRATDLVGHPSVSADDARKILFDNAAELYGFDLELLRPHIDRVGFELSEVMAPAAA